MKMELTRRKTLYFQIFLFSHLYWEQTTEVRCAPSCQKNIWFLSVAFLRNNLIQWKKAPCSPEKGKWHRWMDGWNFIVDFWRHAQLNCIIINFQNIPFLIVHFLAYYPNTHFIWSFKGRTKYILWSYQQ